jgi:hypothetical protein
MLVSIYLSSLPFPPAFFRFLAYRIALPRAVPGRTTLPYSPRLLPTRLLIYLFHRRTLRRIRRHDTLEHGHDGRISEHLGRLHDRHRVWKRTGSVQL